MTEVWVLKKDGHKVKEFPTRAQCLIECVERGWVMRGGVKDFPGDSEFRGWVKGVEIKQVWPVMREPDNLGE